MKPHAALVLFSVIGADAAGPALAADPRSPQAGWTRAPGQMPRMPTPFSGAAAERHNDYRGARPPRAGDAACRHTLALDRR